MNCAEKIEAIFDGEFVDSVPFALKSLKTAIVPAGAVAGASEPKIMESGRSLVNKYTKPHVTINVINTCTINIMTICLPILFKKGKEKLNPII